MFLSFHGYVLRRALSGTVSYAASPTVVDPTASNAGTVLPKVSLHSIRLYSTPNKRVRLLLRLVSVSSVNLMNFSSRCAALDFFAPHFLDSQHVAFTEKRVLILCVSTALGTLTSDLFPTPVLLVVKAFFSYTFVADTVFTIAMSATSAVWSCSSGKGSSTFSNGGGRLYIAALASKLVS